MIVQKGKKEPSPSFICGDCQSVKVDRLIVRGPIAWRQQKVKSLKTQIMVDTLALVWAVPVQVANLSDTIRGY
jgi:hypothetical protein